MQTKYQTMSQKTARENIGNPEEFVGGTYVTRNGVSQLFVQPVAEREAELAAKELERQKTALVKMAMMAKSDAENGNTMSVDEALAKLRARRK